MRKNLFSEYGLPITLTGIGIIPLGINMAEAIGGFFIFCGIASFFLSRMYNDSKNDEKSMSIINIQNKKIYTVDELCQRWNCSKQEIIYHMSKGLGWYYDNDYKNLHKEDSFDILFWGLLLLPSMLKNEKLSQLLPTPQELQGQQLKLSQDQNPKYNNVQIEKITFHIDHIKDYEDKHIKAEKVN